MPDADEVACLTGVDAWRARRLRPRIKLKPRPTYSLKDASTNHTYNGRIEGLDTHGRPTCIVTNRALHLDRTYPERLRVSYAQSLVLIDDRSVYRSAIVALFASGYFPTSIGSSHLAEILDQWTNVQSPAMAAGNDALGLLYVGHAHNDARLVLAGRQRHATTISLLRRELDQRVQSTSGIIAAAQNLLSCEIYNAVSSGLQGCRVHLAGIAVLFSRICGIRMQSLFHTFLATQYGHISLMSGLVERKAMPRFGADMQTKQHFPGSISALISTAMTLPAMLEEFDRLNEDLVAPKCQAKNLQRKLKELEVELLTWLVRYEHNAVARASSHGSGSLRDSSRRSSKLKNRPQQPKFRSFLDAVTHCFHATLLLLVRHCLCGLMLDATKVTSQSSTLVTQTNASAMQICESMDFISTTAGSPLSQALVVRAPFHFLESWYRWKRDAEAVNWCRSKQDQLKARLPFIDWDALLPWSFIAIHWDDDSECSEQD